MNSNYKDKKGEQKRVNPKNVPVEINSYKKFCELFPDAKELKILTKKLNYPSENNILTIHENYQNNHISKDQHIFPDEVQNTGEHLPPERRIYETNTIIRDQYLPRQIKEMYGYRCQICEIRLEAGDYWYAEAAHIRALGTPHNGNDLLNNILCLCPNHHKLFDMGGFSIEDDLSIPVLRVHSKTQKPRIQITISD